MKNDICANFIECVKKLNDNDIVLTQKFDDIYDETIFFNKKKRYVMNFCVICDFRKMFIYMLTNWFNFQHNVRIWNSISINHKFQIFFFENNIF